MDLYVQPGTALKPLHKTNLHDTCTEILIIQVYNRTIFPNMLCLVFRKRCILSFWNVTKTKSKFAEWKYIVMCQRHRVFSDGVSSNATPLSRVCRGGFCWRPHFAGMRQYIIINWTISSAIPVLLACACLDFKCLVGLAGLALLGRLCNTESGLMLVNMHVVLIWKIYQ